MYAYIVRVSFQAQHSTLIVKEISHDHQHQSRVWGSADLVWWNTMNVIGLVFTEVIISVVDFVRLGSPRMQWETDPKVTLGINSWQIKSHLHNNAYPQILAINDRYHQHHHCCHQSSTGFTIMAISVHGFHNQSHRSVIPLHVPAFWCPLKSNQGWKISFQKLTFPWQMIGILGQTWNWTVEQVYWKFNK